jgi:HEAT repeat protein
MTSRPPASAGLPPRPARLALGGALSCAVLALAACQGDSGRTGRSSGGGGGGDSRVVGATAIPSQSLARLGTVDDLVTQWDASQADGREESAGALAGRIRGEVDADLPTFATAVRGDWGRRAQNVAVKALGFSGDPSATTLLVERLREADPAMVGNALIALKLRADPATPLPPIVALLRSKASDVRRFAPLALANVALAREGVGSPVEPRIADEALPALVSLTQESDPVVRLHAAKAVGALRRPDANDFLVVLLRDEHPRIRVAAAAALERIGDPRTFPPVVRLLQASDDDVKPLVRDVLVSYAERLQGSPLTDAQKQELGTSAFAWERWFASRSGAPAPKEPAGGGSTATPGPVPPPTR